MEMKDFYDYAREISKLRSAMSLIAWDMRTKIPPKGVKDRSEVVGKLSRMAFEMATSPKAAEFVEYFNRPKIRDSLNEVDRRNVDLMTKYYRRQKSIPADKIEKFSILCSKGESIWQEARRESNFAKFQPILEEIVEYLKEFAELYGYEENRYDALLDEYEPSTTTKDVKNVIDGLKKDLVPFMQKIYKAKAPDDRILNGNFAKSSQEKLSVEVLKVMTYDFEGGRLDETAHPFTIGIGPGDVRITTKYDPRDLRPSFFGTMHEGGHALYEQGIAEEHQGTMVGMGASMGIHESQSRTWENMIGRSRAFWNFFYPTLVKVFPQYKDVSVEDFYKAINVVKPSLIRIEADEVTYNLHIVIRFEIEEALINDRVKVADLPELWNSKVKEYLGIEPSNDAEGVLQDVHWSGGQMGYFPSYMLGNIYAAQFFATAKKEIPSLEALISSGDLKTFREWQREKIHRHGALYDPKDLVMKVTGEPPTHKYFIDYITEKFSEIYGI